MHEQVVILGAGESGVGAAVLAKAKGFVVFVSDNGLIPSKYRQALKEHQIDFEEGGHDSGKILSASEIVKSPGIPDTAPIIVKAIEKGIPVVSEIEFALRYTKARLIGITGTNGKTTTTLLTYHLLKENGFDVGLTGNIGQSLAMQIATADKDFYVIELSSFQLDGMLKAHLNVAILLNVTPDHLNRYDNDFEKYLLSKFRICQNMVADDVFIYNQSDIQVKEQVKALFSPVKRYPISTEKMDTSMAYPVGKDLVFDDGGEIMKITSTHLPLLGKHNMINTMAAVAAVRSMGLQWDGIMAALKTFKNAPHRLEYVGSINGVDFYNDSKATNVDAVWYALESFEKPLILIMGGTDKGNDYTQIDELVKDKVKAIVALGADNSKIQKHFKTYVKDVLSTDSVFNAIEIAYTNAKPGHVVLLSPACASFDLFKNYEDRGDRFKEAFKALKNKVESNQKVIL